MSKHWYVKRALSSSLRKVSRFMPFLHYIVNNTHEVVTIHLEMQITE